MPQSANQEEQDHMMGRVARKKQAARGRIIQAAEQLMRSRPVEDVTLQDITSAADIGHGSFYLHFKSKYEVLLPIIERLARRWDESIQQHVRELEDPAEVLSFSSRQMGRAIAGDPLWRWLLQHSGVPVADMREAVGRFAARDLGKGLISRRFHVPDLSLATGFMMGAFVNGLLASFEADDQNTAIDQMVELLLRTLGLQTEEAQRIAHLPLTPIKNPEDSTS